MISIPAMANKEILKSISLFGPKISNSIFLPQNGQENIKLK